MKKSLNAWTVDPAAGFEQMFRELKAAGFDGVELNVDREGAGAHSLTLSTTREELAAVKALSQRYEVQHCISSQGGKPHPPTPSPPTRGGNNY